jgi:protein ImuB
VIVQRPLKLFSKPVPVQAISVVPEGPPLQMHFAGSEHRIARSWGPERIETGWWRGRMIGRDYYRIETTLGCRFWVFRALDDEHWFLHGAFD